MAQHDGMNVEYTNPTLGHTGTSTVIPIEAYFTQIQQCLNTTLTELSELRKSHGALESRVSDMHTSANMKDDSQGEPSFAVKPYTGDNKEHTEEAISTWLGHWESHFKLHPKPDITKIAYVSRELGGKAAAWWCGLRIVEKLPTSWADFVTTFKKKFLQPPCVGINVPRSLQRCMSNVKPKVERACMSVLSHIDM